jgi:hypothetical protein
MSLEPAIALNLSTFVTRRKPAVRHRVAQEKLCAKVRADEAAGAFFRGAMGERLPVLAKQGFT